MKVKVPARSQLWAVSHMRTYHYQPTRSDQSTQLLRITTTADPLILLVYRNQLFVAQTSDTTRWPLRKHRLPTVPSSSRSAWKFVPRVGPFNRAKSEGGLCWCSQVSVLVARLCRSSSGRRCRLCHVASTRVFGEYCNSPLWSTLAICLLVCVRVRVWCLVKVEEQVCCQVGRYLICGTA